MKLITYRHNQQEEIGLLKDNHIIPINDLGFSYKDMNDLIIHSNKEELYEIERLSKQATNRVQLVEVKVLSPIPRPTQDILCLGLNYLEHAKEAEDYSNVFESIKENAIYFSKRVSYSQGTKDSIPSHSDITEKLDYENELAIIIGKDAKDVKKEEVVDYIFGYTILNDVTARDLQTKHKQWYFGKSLDGFAPMGPCIVTSDEINYPPELNIITYVNGEKRQESNTRLLIHTIDEIICELSQGMTLKAGTIIATGTPKGVAMGMDNPKFLKEGDRITCCIEGIGELENVIN